MDKPEPGIYRFLISTTSRFTGEYQSEDISIDHAWPGTGSRYLSGVGLRASPHSRNYYVLSVAIEPPEKKTIVIPNYSGFGERVCAAMSVLYGKRFDSHGFLVSNQMFYVPDFSPIEPTAYYTAAPYSHEPRKDLSIPLKLDHFKAVARLFDDPNVDERFSRIFFAAARFYLRSVQMFDVEPEFAYLDLITCGEVLANFYVYTPEEVYDPDSRRMFARIEAEMKNGDKVVRQLQSKMRQIKRRYILTLTRLLTDSFFAVSECTETYGRLRKDDIEKRLKAAYDLRSLYVHTGINFGHWTHPHGGTLNEVPLGSPMVDNEAFKEAMELAPTFFGLERIMRYCLARFLHLNGVPIDPSLDNLAIPAEAPAAKEEAVSPAPIPAAEPPASVETPAPADTPSRPEAAPEIREGETKDASY